MSGDSEDDYIFENLTCEPYDYVENEEDGNESNAHKDINSFFQIGSDENLMLSISNNIGIQAITAIIIFLIVYLLGTFVFRDIPNRLINASLNNKVRLGGNKTKK